MKVKTGVVVGPSATVDKQVEVIMDSPIISKKGLLGDLALLGSGLLLMVLGGICMVREAHIAGGMSYCKAADVALQKIDCLDKDIEPGCSWGVGES